MKQGSELGKDLGNAEAENSKCKGPMVETQCVQDRMIRARWEIRNWWEMRSENHTTSQKRLEAWERRLNFVLWQGEGDHMCFRAGIPNVWDLMPDDLRWSWCSNNRNKVHSKCNKLESSPNHPSPLVCGKIIFHKTGPWRQKGWGPLL